MVSGSSPISRLMRYANSLLFQHSRTKNTTILTSLCAKTLRTMFAPSRLMLENNRPRRVNHVVKSILRKLTVSTMKSQCPSACKIILNSKGRRLACDEFRHCRRTSRVYDIIGVLSSTMLSVNFSEIHKAEI